jgi:hypothetical protein
MRRGLRANFPFVLLIYLNSVSCHVWQARITFMWVCLCFVPGLGGGEAQWYGFEERKGSNQELVNLC